MLRLAVRPFTSRLGGGCTGLMEGPLAGWAKEAAYSGA